MLIKVKNMGGGGITKPIFVIFALRKFEKHKSNEYERPRNNYRISIDKLKTS